MARVNPSASKMEMRRAAIHNEYKSRMDAAKKRLADRHRDAQKLLDEAVDEYETERQAAYALERRDLLIAHAEERKADTAKASKLATLKIPKPSVLKGK